MLSALSRAKRKKILLLLFNCVFNKNVLDHLNVIYYHPFMREPFALTEKRCVGLITQHKFILMFFGGFHIDVLQNRRNNKNKKVVVLYVV